MITVEISPGGVGFIRRSPASDASGIPLSARPAWLTGSPEAPPRGSASRRSLRADEYDI